MAINPEQSEAAANRYRARFQTYVARGIEQAACELAAAPDRLPDELRKQGVHLIGLGLEIPALWGTLRRLLLLLSPKMEQAGFRDEWIFFLEKALVAAQQQQDAETEVELHLQSGRLYEFTGDLAAANAHFQQGLTLAEAAGNQRNQGRCLGRLAYIARLRYELATATELANRALQLIARDDPERARIHSVLGTIAYDQQAWETSLEHYQQTLAIWERVGDKRMIAWSLRDLGTVYRRQSKLEQAIAYYERALQLFDTNHDPAHQASTCMNLGNVYLDLNQPNKALGLYELALSVFHDLHDLRRLAMGYKNMGIVYRKLQLCEKAVQAFQHSIQIRYQLHNPNMLVDAMVELGLTYIEFKLNQQAVVIFTQAKEQLALVAEIDNPLHDTISQYLQ